MPKETLPSTVRRVPRGDISDSVIGDEIIDYSFLSQTQIDVWQPDSRDG